MPRKTKTGLLRETIRKDLLDQLERNGTVGKYYADLVEDYLRLWDVKRGLAEDIRKRGPKVTVYTATSANLKTNDSVLDIIKVNAQMLKLIDSLGIKPAQTDGDGDDL